MKPLHRLSAIVVSFCLGWGLTRLFTEPTKQATTGQTPVLLAKTPPRAISGRSQTKPAARALAKDFSSNAPSRWSEIWASFAQKATAEELAMVQKLPTEVATWVGGGVSEALRVLAEEELSLRLDSPLLQRHGVAALAETNPEAAWKAVGEAHASMVSAAVLRTLAAKDPVAALEKVRALGVERGPEYNGENGVVHGPLGSIFAAWTRRNPAAAMAAAEALPKGDKHTARSEIALSLAYSDGAAALQYLADKDLLEKDQLPSMNALLRAIFSQAPTPARAAVLQEHPEIFKATDEPYDFLGPWLRMDREGALAFIRTQKLGVRCLGLLIEQDPAAALQTAQQDGFGAAKHYPPVWTALYAHFPAEVQELAGQQGCWPAVQQRLAKDQANETGQPATRLKAMLALISKDGLEKVAATFPRVGKTPAEQLEGYLDCAQRYMPEAAPALESLILQAKGMKRPSRDTLSPSLSAELFGYDPAAAAQRLSEKPMQTWDAWHAVDYWAPYDFAAAEAWVAALPDGEAKRHAEISLLEHGNSLSGEAILTKLLAEDPKPYYTARVSSGPSGKLTETWKKGLRSIARAGGDWRAWLEKLPASYTQDGVTRTQFDMLAQELKEGEKQP